MKSRSLAAKKLTSSENHGNCHYEQHLKTLGDTGLLRNLMTRKNIGPLLLVISVK